MKEAKQILDEEVRVFIILGSNVEPKKNLYKAYQMLDKLFTIEAKSKIYLSKPAFNQSNNDFLNAGIIIHTKLLPEILKYDIFRKIEKKLKRKRTTDKNSPRTIDIDISFYGKLIIDNDKIKIPDPDIHKFSHLAFPLADLDSEFRHPVIKKKLGEIKKSFQNCNDIRVYAEDFDKLNTSSQ